MLSSREVENIRRQLEDNPSRNARKRLRKKLKEHEYASTYQGFTPLSHQRYFVNRETEERTLIEMIQAANEATIFLLETESVLIHHQPNRPGLIQLQVIPTTDTSPIVLIVELNHLPSTNSNAFLSIQQLFRIVLDSTKVIYTWGTIAELDEFAQFNLFNSEQIKSADNRNLQEMFAQYWRESHEHTMTENCRCEECIGKGPNEYWSLQDAVASQLGEWLDKRHTCSNFGMGLDPRLHQSDPMGHEYRRILTDYAANDVLAMEKLMISMQEQALSSELDQLLEEENVDLPQAGEQIEADPNQENTANHSTHPGSNDQSTIANLRQEQEQEQGAQREDNQQQTGRWSSEQELQDNPDMETEPSIQHESEQFEHDSVHE